MTYRNAYWTAFADHLASKEVSKSWVTRFLRHHSCNTHESVVLWVGRYAHRHCSINRWRTRRGEVVSANCATPDSGKRPFTACSTWAEAAHSGCAKPRKSMSAPDAASEAFAER
ncbi:hypothetical protein IG631_23167 [Alternaria alternata]|nr:hypothetical protein IG631_23167 [Alternaria alternata]